MTSPRAPRIVGDPSPDGNHAPGKRITHWPHDPRHRGRVHLHPPAACRIQEGQVSLLDAGEEGLASVLLLSGRERPTRVRNGVLTVTFPRVAARAGTRRIPIAT